MYKEIKSKYIKEKIKDTKWKKREYIQDLIRIEWLATGRTFGLATGYAMKNLPDIYPKEWKAIWNELNSKGYEKLIKQKENEIEEERIFELKEKTDTSKEKKEWKELGGK